MMAVARHPVLPSYDQLSDAGQGPSRNGMDSGISFVMHADWGTLLHTAELGEGDLSLGWQGIMPHEEMNGMQAATRSHRYRRSLGTFNYAMDPRWRAELP